MGLLWIPCYLNIHYVLDVSDIWSHSCIWSRPLLFYLSCFYPWLCLGTPQPAHSSLCFCIPVPDFAHIYAAIDAPSTLHLRSHPGILLCMLLFYGSVRLWCFLLGLMLIMLCTFAYLAPNGSHIVFPFQCRECSWL